MMEVEEEGKAEAAQAVAARAKPQLLPPPLPPRKYKLRRAAEQRRVAAASTARARAIAAERVWVEELAIPGSSVRVDLQEKVQRPFVVYYLQVRASDGRGWTVEKRFSELFAWAKQVRAALKTTSTSTASPPPPPTTTTTTTTTTTNATAVVLPRFPSRFTHKRTLSRELVEYRRQALEAYMQGVLAAVQAMDAETPSGRALWELLDGFLATAENARQPPSRLRSRGGSFMSSGGGGGGKDGKRLVADKVILQAQELIKAVARDQPRFVHGASRSSRVVVDPKSSGGAQLSPAQEAQLMDLGRIVALQQQQVDRYAARLLRAYKPSKLPPRGQAQQLALEPERKMGDYDSDGSGGESEDEISVALSESLLNNMRALGQARAAPSSRARAYMGGLLSIRKRRGSAKVDASAVGEELLARAHRYLAQISWKVLGAHAEPLQARAGEEYDEDYAFDVLYRLFEVSLVKRHATLRERLLDAAAACGDVAQENARVVANRAALQEHFEGRGVPPSLFGACVHPCFTVHDGGDDDREGEAAMVRGVRFSWGWESAVARLNEMDDAGRAATPSAKVELVLKCVDEIHRGLAHSTSSAKEGERVLGADDVVPILFYAIACSDLADPCITHRWMATLASDALMDTEAKYWLTVFESGLQFLACLDLDVDLDSAERIQMLRKV